MFTVNLDEKKFDNIIDKLKGINPEIKKVLDKTAKNCQSKAPSEITKAVTAVYGIESSRMNKEGRLAKKYAKTVIGQIKVHGIHLTVIRLTYISRRLSPRSFGVKPKSLSDLKNK